MTKKGPIIEVENRPHRRQGEVEQQHNTHTQIAHTYYSPLCIVFSVNFLVINALPRTSTLRRRYFDQDRIRL